MKCRFTCLISATLVMTSVIFIEIFHLGVSVNNITITGRNVHSLLQTPSATPSTIRESVTLNDGVYTYHLNLSQFQSQFPYLQSYHCSHILTPRAVPSFDVTHPLLILAIKSHPRSGFRREALRRTWAREGIDNGYRVKPIFLVGRTEVLGDMEIVKVENTEFGDILQWDINEGHYNLSLKERCFLEWLHYQVPHVAFIFKGDDDEYVNPEAVVQYIQEYGCSPRTLHGYVQRHSTVMRSTKYRVSESLYPLHKYPTFLSGGGFLFPGASLKVLYEASQRMPVFPLDDVYFGFLALAANLTFRHDHRFHVTRIKSDACKYQQALVVHGIETEKLVEVWNSVKNAKCKHQ